MSELKNIWNIVIPNLVKLARYPAPVRMGVFLVILFWLPIAVPIYLLVRDPNLVTILAMGLLFGEFLLLLRLWGRKVYRQPQLLESYGRISTRQNGLDLLKGLGVGLLFTFGLFVLQGYWVGWNSSSLKEYCHRLF